MPHTVALPPAKSETSDSHFGGTPWRRTQVPGATPSLVHGRGPDNPLAPPSVKHYLHIYEATLFHIAPSAAGRRSPRPPRRCLAPVSEPLQRRRADRVADLVHPVAPGPLPAGAAGGRGCWSRRPGPRVRRRAGATRRPAPAGGAAADPRPVTDHCAGAVFTTPRLTVGTWTHQDAATLLDIYSRWEVARWLGAAPRPLRPPRRRCGWRTSGRPAAGPTRPSASGGSR